VHADRSKRFYIHPRSDISSAVIGGHHEDDDTLLVTPRRFTIQGKTYVFTVGRKQLGSCVPFDDDTAVAPHLSTVIGDHRPYGERHETIALQAFDTGPTVVEGAAPTDDGVALFFVWLVMRRGYERYEKYVTVGPNGEMDDSSLRRAFSIFWAERRGRDGGLLAAYDAMEAELEARHASQHSLNNSMYMDDDEGELLWDPSILSPTSSASSRSSSGDDARTAAGAAAVGGDGAAKLPPQQLRRPGGDMPPLV